MSKSAPLTEYEEQRQRNIKDLHDSVQAALLTAGFGEAAGLRKASTVLHDPRGGVRVSKVLAKELSVVVLGPRTSTTRIRGL
jgi:hypothetical protein